MVVMIFGEENEEAIQMMMGHLVEKFSTDYFADVCGEYQEK